MSILSGAWRVMKGTVSGGLSAMWGKLGLWLGYVAIGIAIALGCAAIWFYHQNAELHEAVGSLNSTIVERGDTIKQLQIYNAQQDRAIDELTAIRKMDNLVVTGLLSDYKRISATAADTKSKLKELEKHNAEVRSYLNTPLPASVRRVLNDAPAPASSAGGDAGSSGATAQGFDRARSVADQRVRRVGGD